MTHTEDTMPERLTADEITSWAAKLEGWEVVDGHHLRKTFRFVDFAAGLAFVNRVGAVAEEADHHPEVELAWGRVVLEIFTHDIGGLAAQDFEIAARWDRLAQ